MRFMKRMLFIFIHFQWVSKH